MPVVPFIPAIISGGAALGGSAIASHGNTKAAETQAGATKEAIASQERMFQQEQAEDKRRYEQARADNAPLLGLSNAVIGPLAYGLGVDATPKPDLQAAPAGPMVSLSGQQIGTPTGPQLPVNAAAIGPDKAAELLRQKIGYTPRELSEMKTRSGYAQVQAPNNTTYQLPWSKVPDALVNGGKLVNANG